MNIEKLNRTQMNLSAPVDERRDARQELMSAFLPTAHDLPPQGDVNQLVSTILESPDIMKSREVVGGFWNDPKPGQPQSVLQDMRGLYGAAPGAYRSRPSNFSTHHLRLMVEQVPLINAIILRRIRTITRFLRPSEPDRELGFRIRRRDDESAHAQRGKVERWLEQFLLHSGDEFNPVAMRRLRRDHLHEFMARSIRDILTLDGWAIETVMSQDGKHLSGYHAVDAGSIYLASEEGYNGDDEVIAVQVVQGMVTTTYTIDELIYVVQNPRTDVLFYGYGYAPPEMVVKVVTGYLNALQYNLRGFDTNSIPKGLLTVFGHFDQKQLNAFKRQWNAMVSGVNNAWALPVLASDGPEGGAKFERFGVEFSDMYFAKWMVLLTSIVCSVYGIDPTEVYAESFSAGRSTLSGSDLAERLADARDTGLEPLMTFIERILTDYILARVSDEHDFRFYGLHPYDQQWRHEQSKMVQRVDEMREELGMDPLGGLIGNAPLNGSLMGLYQAQAQQAMQEQMGGAQEEEPEAIEEESGDREPLPEHASAELQEAGDREEPPSGPVPNPEIAERDRSTMAKGMMFSAYVVRP